MSVTVADVVEEAAEFMGLVENPTTPDGDPIDSSEWVSEKISKAISQADPQVSLTAWGELRDYAVILLAAHDLSKKYPGARPGDYDSERYVKELDRIRNTLGLTMTVL
jgi:hypothetical protein